MFDHTNGTIITTSGNSQQRRGSQNIDFKKNERIIKKFMDVSLFVGCPIFIIVAIVNSFFNEPIIFHVWFIILVLLTCFMIATFVKLFFLMKRCHNYEFEKNKKSMLIFFFQTLFLNLMTLVYWVMIAQGIQYNYPIPQESFDSCKGTAPYITAIEWLIYVPGIKCRLWVITFAYFVIHVK